MNRLAKLTPRHRRAACHCIYRPMDFPDSDGRLPMLRTRSDDCPEHRHDDKDTDR